MKRMRHAEPPWPPDVHGELYGSVRRSTFGGGDRRIHLRDRSARRLDVEKRSLDTPRDTPAVERGWLPHRAAQWLQKAQRWAAAALSMPDGQDKHHVYAWHIVDVVSRSGQQETPGADDR